MISEIPDSDFERVRRYVTGDLTTEEHEATRLWIAGHASRMQLAAELGDVWELAGRIVPDVDTVSGRARIATLLDDGISSAHPSSSAAIMPPTSRVVNNGVRIETGRATRAFPTTMYGRRTSWGRVTAGIGAALALIIGVKMIGGSLGHHQPVVHREYATHRGERATTTLPDGSTLILAPETRVRYTSASDGTRTVDLEGQAYFVVSHTDTRPFIVRSGATQTRVLGTAFAVEWYHSDAAARVVVQSGRVAASRHGRQIVLSAGMIGEITDSSATERFTTDPDRNVAWTNGWLEFQEVPAKGVLEALGRWYGYTFKLTDTTLDAQHFSLSVRTDRFQEALKTVETILGATATVNDGVVTLRPKRNTDRQHLAPVRRAPAPFTPQHLEVGK